MAAPRRLARRTSSGARTARLRVLALGAGLTAVGCTASLDPIDVGPGCPKAPLRGPEEFAGASTDLMIDDFEDGEIMLLPQVAGRNGYWFSNSDGSSVAWGGITTDRCFARGTSAAHFYGGGFAGWGAHHVAYFLEAGFGGAAVPYDATAFSGISFWAAVGFDIASPLEVPVGVLTMDTAVNAGRCTVCDYHRTTVVLTDAWQRHVIRFADLAQAGNGPATPLRLEEAVALMIWPTGDYRIFIDDIRFERP